MKLMKDRKEEKVWKVDPPCDWPAPPPRKQKSENYTNFKVGDIVQLRSGSPDLTVCCTYPRATESGFNQVRVSWFNEGTLKESDITKATLILIKENYNGTE